MTTRATTPYRLQPRTSFINRVILPQANFSESRYILQTVQACAKVTIELEYKVICDLLNGVNDLEKTLTRVSRS